MLLPSDYFDLKWLLIPVAIFTRYLLNVLLLFIIFYMIKRRQWLYRKIQQRFPQKSDYWREIGYSAITSLIFAGYIWLCLGTPLRTHTLFYREISQHGVGWLMASIPLSLLVHDTWFYWIHRLMHGTWSYRKVHLIHHQSVNPSPWAAYAFHPLEAVLEAGIIPLLLFLMPMHPISFLGFVTFMLLFNIYGHLGYELFPKTLYQHPIGKWINSSIYHNLHHEKFQGNYGLYLTFWDRVCGTLRTDSTEKIEEVHNRIAGRHKT